MAEFNRTSSYTFGFNYINLNVKSALLSDARVRRALTMLTDRDSLVRDLYKGTAKVVSGPFNPKTHWYDHSVKWVQENAPTDSDYRRFREEAAALMEIEE